MPFHAGRVLVEADAIGLMLRVCVCDAARFTYCNSTQICKTSIIAIQNMDIQLYIQQPEMFYLQCQRAHLQQVCFDLGNFLCIISFFFGKKPMKI
jgi:hypothetical protein